MDESVQLKEKLGAKKIVCRLCKGDHFTSKCPHKAILAPITGDGGKESPSSSGDLVVVAKAYIVDTHSYRHWRG